MAWQKLRLQIASALLIMSIVVTTYGIVTLLLFKYKPWLLLSYMGLAVLTIPIFVLVHSFATANARHKTAAEADRRERVFIKLYELNLVLAGGVWASIAVVLALKVMA